MAMRVGMRIVLHGLKTAVELNQTYGVIVIVESEKVVVKMKQTERVIRVHKNKVIITNHDMVLMEWGTDASRLAFNEEWRRTIAIMDGEVFQRSESNIYKYLIAKVKHVVNTKRMIGGSGWAFSRAQGSDFVCGVVWADGTHNQELPIQWAAGKPSRADERWWPCVCLSEPLLHTGLLPFYCPAIAWDDARPWMVHPDRVRFIETPGPFIEEEWD